MLFFETWEINDPSKSDEHDELCREWITHYVHAYLGEAAVPHKLYTTAYNPVARAMSVEVTDKEHMDKVMETLFADQKFMEYYKKWEKYLDKPVVRGFWNELNQEEQRTSYLKAKQSK
jgi:hypothetical protein